MPGQTFNNDVSQLSYAQRQQLGVQDPHLQLAAQGSSIRELSIEESQRFYKAVSAEAKGLIGLIYAGLNVDELAQLNQQQFSADFSQLNLSSGRQLALHPALSETIKEYVESNSQDSFWISIDSVKDFDQFLANEAHDAQLNEPDSITIEALRHTYILYLVGLGVKLKDISKIVGQISQSDLAKYRNNQKVGSSVDIKSVDIHYPIYQ